MGLPGEEYGSTPEEYSYTPVEYGSCPWRIWVCPMKNKGLALKNVGLPHVEYGSTPWRITVYPWRMWFYPCRIWVYLWKILWQLIKASAPKNSTIFYSTPKEILQLFELTPEEFHWSSSEGRRGTDTVFNAIVACEQACLQANAMGLLKTRKQLSAGTEKSVSKLGNL